jgi:hypothetical protein
MTAFINSLLNAITSTLAVCLSRTASGTSEALDISNYEGTIEITLMAGAKTAGTNPTLDVKLQECDTDDGTPTDVYGGAFTQVTTVAGTQVKTLEKTKLKKFLFLNWTIGGTNAPAFPFGAVSKAFEKYPS